MHFIEPRQWNTACRDAKQHVHAEHREEKPERSAENGEQGAFHQQRADDMPAPRAESRSNGHFPRSRGGARQHQIRDVGASDQEYQRHGAHQKVQGGANISDKLIAQRSGHEALVAVGIRKSSCQARANSIQMRPGVLQRNSRLQFRDGSIIERRAIEVLGSQRRWHPDVGPARELETRRNNAGNLVSLVLDADSLAERICARAEVTLRKWQAHDGCAVNIVVVEQPSGGRFNTEHTEEIRVDKKHTGEFGTIP